MGEDPWPRYDEVRVDDEFEFGNRYGISEEFGSSNIRYSIIDFDPGEGGDLHYHTPPIEEYYFVLGGELDITVGDETRTAKQGSIIYVPPGEQHQPRNNTDETATLLAVSSPPVLPHSDRTVYLD